MTDETNALPAVDTICLRMANFNDTALHLWMYCVNAWLADEDVDAADYFNDAYEGVVEDDIEESVRVDEEGEVIDEDGDEDIVVDPEDDDDEPGSGYAAQEMVAGISDAAAEEMALEAPYIAALNDFWSKMNIFKTDMPSITQWTIIVKQINLMVKHIPSDPGKLIDHIRRINNARVHAETSTPKNGLVATGTPLHDLLNTRF